MGWLWWSGALGCGEGCLHGRLSDWCHHSESDGGPVGEGECEEVTLEPGTATFGCGDYDIDFFSGGFSSTSMYFDHDSGELVAVKYTKDVNTYCGDFSYWYGRRIRCKELCGYDSALADEYSVPLCPGS